MAAALITGKNVKDGSLTGADVKSNSLGSSDVKNGNLLAKDFKAGQLPAGSPGPRGPQGVPGQPGQPGPFPDVLPSGKTIRGTYAVGGVTNTTGVGQSLLDNISFGFQLATAPTAHLMTSGAAATQTCPGSNANPQAASGHLCVYENTRYGASTLVAINNPAGPGGGASRWGAMISAIGFDTAEHGSYGSWAVTG